VGAVGRAQPAEDPFGLGSADRVQDTGAVFGQLDQRGPTVVRVGAPLDQIPGFEGIDDLRGRTRRDVQVVRQLRQAHHPEATEHAQRPQLRRVDIPGSQGLLGGFAQLTRDRPERFGQGLVTGHITLAGHVTLAGRITLDGRVAILDHRNRIPPSGVVASY
jgi:hypothetical protein